MLRELSGLAVECAREQSGELRQGYALLALSLLHSTTGEPIYSPDTIENGMIEVMNWPQRIAQQLTDAVQELNAATMDEARKN